MKIEDIPYRTRIYERYATVFKDLSETFDTKEASHWGRSYNYYLRNWLPKNKNASIVDVACGSGKLLYFFKNKHYQNITGVDISPEQVKLARQVSLTVDEADVLDWLGAHPSTFDLITGLDIIEHLDKSEVLRFIEACYLALKPGGRFVLQTPNAESLWEGSLRHGDFTHELSFTPNLLLRLLKLSGFQDIEVRETGPIPWGYSLTSTMRYLIWQFIRMGLKLWNLAEIGRTGSGVFTRVFLVTGLRVLD